MNRNPQESVDAVRVQDAHRRMLAGDRANGEAMLLEVIANTPSDYENVTEDPDGSLVIRFWNHETFLHFCRWASAHSLGRSVRWELNAYPLAHFVLGFHCVNAGQLDRAVDLLGRGLMLEPTNPLFPIELAHVLGRLGDWENALRLLEPIREVGPFVNPLALARTRRARAAAYVELGRLDDAEAAYRASLEAEPDNPIALRELKYIAALRAGMQPVPSEGIVTHGPKAVNCVDCGMPAALGTVVDERGVARVLCASCAAVRDGKRLGEGEN